MLERMIDTVKLTHVWIFSRSAFNALSTLALSLTLAMAPTVSPELNYNTFFVDSPTRRSSVCLEIRVSVHGTKRCTFIHGFLISTVVEEFSWLVIFETAHDNNMSHNVRNSPSAADFVLTRVGEHSLFDNVAPYIARYHCI